MGRIVFGWKNLCLEDGTTFTPSTEAANHDADNLGKPHPRSYWRMTSPSQQTLNVTTPTSDLVDLYAILYATATPHRGLLEHTGDPLNAEWVETGLAFTLSAGGPITGEGGETLPAMAVTEDTSTGVHRLEQTGLTKPADSAAGFQEMAVGVDGYFYSTGAGASKRHVRIQAIGSSASHFATADFDLTTGAVHGSPSTNGDFIDVDAAVVDMGGGVYRCKFACITDINGHDIDAIRVDMLDSAFDVSYTGTSQWLGIYGLKAEYIPTDSASTVSASDLRDNWIQTESGRAPTWAVVPNSANGVDDLDPVVGGGVGIEGTAGDSYMRHFAMRSDEIEIYNRRGWMHSAFHNASTLFARQFTFLLHDPDNIDGQLDVSGVYAGPSWQPTRNIAENYSWGIDHETGGRVLSGEIAWATEDDAYADGLPMALWAGVGSKSSVVADGGQEFRAGKRPILVILDPAEDTYAQEQMIYGYLDEFAMKPNKWIGDVDEAGNSGLAWAIEFTVKEVLP